MNAELRRHIERLPAGSSIKTDTELAQQYSVSPRTIRRWMKAYEKEGLVARIRGRGTYRLPFPVPPHPTKVTSSSPRSRDRLVGQLREAIARGEIRRGDPLPRSKYLQLHYHVSNRTINRAYAEMEQQGLAYRVGRHYYAGALMPAVHPLANHDIFLVVDTESDFDRVYDVQADLMAPAYVACERELRALGMTLRYMTAGELKAEVAHWKRDSTMPAGIMLWRYDCAGWPYIRKLLGPHIFDTPIPRTRLFLDIQLMGDLQRTPKRTAAINRGNIMTTQSRTVADFAVQSSCASSIGLVYSGDDIRRRGTQWFLRFQKVVFEIQRRTGEQVFSFVVDPQKEIRARDLVDAARTVQPWFFDYLAGKSALSEPAFQQTMTESIQVVDAFGVLAGHNAKRTLLIFPRAQTACVTIDDFRRKGCDIPRDISLLALENNPRSFPRGLSACAPDWDTAGYLMAHAMVGDIPFERTSRGFIRIPSPFIQRLTT